MTTVFVGVTNRGKNGFKKIRRDNRQTSHRHYSSEIFTFDYFCRVTRCGNNEQNNRKNQLNGQQLSLSTVTARELQNTFFFYHLPKLLKESQTIKGQ